MASRKRFKDLVSKAHKTNDQTTTLTPSTTQPGQAPDNGSQNYKPRSKAPKDSTPVSKTSSRDLGGLTSDDSVDELSPLVKKSPQRVPGDSSEDSPGVNGRGQSSKNDDPIDPKDGGVASSSQDDVQSPATLPIQTRVDWVRLASFDQFEDGKNSPSADTQGGYVNDVDQSASSSPPASDTPPENKKLLPDADGGEEEGIPCRDGGAPPEYATLDIKTETKGQDGTVAGGGLEPSACHGAMQTPDHSSHARLLAAAQTVRASVRISRMERARRRAKWAGKKLLVFLVSHIGLTLAVLLYATAGGFLFRWLEMEAEIDRRKKMMDVRNHYLSQMWDETIKLNVLHHTNWTIALRHILMGFERRVYRAISEGTWDGAGQDAVNKWTIPGSLLFSTTVITSIGYGDITPRTNAGKLVCIPFAIVGIPLTLLCLANIGQLLAVAFKFFWRRLTEFVNLCRFCNPRGRDVTITTPDHQRETRIPVLVCVAIVVAYTLGGAAIFSNWETDWSFLDGFYFSFITLSTIGFGDFVPGQYESGTNERRVMCTLYLLTGLSLLSMVFQLMIDSIREVVRRYALIFGLTEEQIAQGVRGIDTNLQEVVSQTPDPALVKDPGTVADKIVCFNNLGSGSASADVGVTPVDQEKNRGDDVIKGCGQLTPPAILISPSDVGETKAITGVESNPAEIRDEGIGPIEYSDFISVKPEDTSLPASGSRDVLTNDKGGNKTDSETTDVRSER